MDLADLVCFVSRTVNVAEAACGDNRNLDTG